MDVCAPTIEQLKSNRVGMFLTVNLMSSWLHSSTGSGAVESVRRNSGDSFRLGGWGTGLGWVLLPLAFSFHDGDVAVDRQVVEAFGSAAGLGPFHFQPVDFCAGAQA